MAISRMNMERQLRNMGGLMTLEEPRQGYFLGKIVRKAKKAVKKVVKSPLGKAALLGAAGMYAGGLGPFAGLRGAGFAKGLGGGISSLLGTGGKLETLGNLFRVGGESGAALSVPRILGGLAGAGAIAAPFFMGGDEEEEDPGVPFGDPIASVEAIRDRARQYYMDPTNSALYFMPPKSAVQSRFYAAGGGLADIPREGYNQGEMVEGIKNVADDENTMMAGLGNVMKLFTNERTGFDRAGFEDMLIQYQDSGAKSKGIKLMDFAIDFLGISSMKEGGLADIPREGYESGERVSGILKLLSRLTPFGAAKELGSNMDVDTLKKLSMFTPAGAARKAGESLANMDMNLLRRLGMFTPVGAGRELAMKDGGMIDMGGLEKDYREGGFVPIGAEERADDVPARLSKNEFVFTADAVRNAGGGDIDKGAEVMQNMMDNLEAGGNISEESQGKENPAQAMFDQAQMLESRIA